MPKPISKLFNSMLLASALFSTSLYFNSAMAAKETDAAKIMKLSDERYTGDTESSLSVLTLVDKKNRQRVRNLKLFSLDKDDV
jgi:hypothetical protein